MERVTSGCERLRASSLRFLLRQFLRTITSLYERHGRREGREERARGARLLAKRGERESRFASERRKRGTKILINRTQARPLYFVRVPRTPRRGLRARVRPLRLTERRDEGESRARARTTKPYRTIRLSFHHAK